MRQNHKTTVRRLQVNSGDQVIVVSDLKPEDNTVVRTIQIRHVPNGSDK